MGWNEVMNIKGPQGDPGTPGAKGDQGDPGVRGATWFTGHGDPTTTPPPGATANDLYLDLDTGNVYQLS